MTVVKEYPLYRRRSCRVQYDKFPPAEVRCPKCKRPGCVKDRDRGEVHCPKHGWLRAETDS